jgi:hypothetical protein
MFYSIDFASGTWYHIAWVRDSGEFRGYIDGVKVFDVTDQTTVAAPASTPLEIGRNVYGNRYFTGDMDQVRISNSARYDANFTAPTTPFTADANTKLLAQSDFSEGGLGADHSGNYNYFTPTNLGVDNMMLDSPMNNFCTWNPLLGNGIDRFTLSEGNLKIVPAGGNWNAITGTMALPDSGKWYWETKSDNANVYIGIVDNAEDLTATNPTGGTVWYGDDGRKRIDGTFSSYGAGYGSANLSGIAVDMDASPRTITFYKDNTSQGVITITGSCATDTVYPYISSLTTNYINFGQDSSFAGQKTAQGNQDGNNKGDFYYAPPTGFLALCTDNLPAPSIALPTDHFNSLVWVGDGTTPRSFTGVGFSPELLWAKNRTVDVSHMLYDIVRGTGPTKTLESEETKVEGGGNADLYGYLSSFDSDGFTTTDGSSSPNYYFNENTRNYVAWNWKAGGTAASNTDGSITSSVSANPTAGFSIVKWTGTGSNATVGHGLSQAPDLIINKSLATVHNWAVQSILWTSASDTNMLYLDTSAAQADDTNVFQAAPTASVFSPQGGAWAGIGAASAYIAYCFHSIEGYSKVGTYIGNGSTNGPFIYTGFKPAFLMVKNFSVGDDWTMMDDERSPYNLVQKSLVANQVLVETDNAAKGMDFISNGVKMRNADNGLNYSGGSFLYLAFAENPFKTSNAR